MPFGMKNATNTFSKTMPKVFGEYLEKFLKVFVDDLNICNHSWEQHLAHLRFVLLKLREINFKLNPGKCEFVKISLTFLGHEVNHDGTQLDPRKIKVIIDFPIPTSIINVKTFLWLISYYQDYVMGYFRIAMPLFDLIKKDIIFRWNHNC
jgi:hypothetical protein